VIAAVVLGILGLVVVAVAWLARGPFVLFAGRVAPAFTASPERLRRDVEMLSVTFHPRDYTHLANLDRAASWIAAELVAAGLQPTVEEYRVREGRYRNVLATSPGTERDEHGVVVVGAHYDAVRGTPGADDNASGVAVLLELARQIRGMPHRKDWVLAAYSTEEPPFFGTGDMGSMRHAAQLRSRGVRVDVMIALDLVGRFSDEPGAQAYPYPGLSLLYPRDAGFIALTGDMGSGPALALVKRGMLRTRALPVVSFRAPRSIGWVDLSDHSSFWAHGYAAVLVTDTGPLRNRDYHGAGDTADRLDYGRMAAVVAALAGAVRAADAR
jgi:hypothetical protein